MPNNAVDDDRPLGTRYRLDEPDGSWWELGWDRPLGTFYAQQYRHVGDVPSANEELVAWHGGRPSELSSVAALAARLPVPIPDDAAHELRRDADAHPHTVDPPFLRIAQAIDAAASGAPIPHNVAGSRTTLPSGPLADALPPLRRDPHPAPDALASLAPGPRPAPAWPH